MDERRARDTVVRPRAQHLGDLLPDRYGEVSPIDQWIKASWKRIPKVSRELVRGNSSERRTIVGGVQTVSYACLGQRDRNDRGGHSADHLRIDRFSISKRSIEFS